MGISVFIIARDEAERIGPCLEALGWADDVLVVVDAATSDATVEIARAHGAVVRIEPWLGFARQCQQALEAVPGEWILRVDADEIVTPELVASVQAAVANPGDHVAYCVPRRNLFWGRVLRCRYPDYTLRLFRRGAGHFGDREVHEGWIAYQPRPCIGHLQGDLIHDSYRGLADCVDKLCRYAVLGAKQEVKEGPVRSIWPAILDGLVTFGKYQFLKGGFRDGIPGFVYNAVHAFYLFYRHALAYELTKAQERERKDTSPV